MLFSEQLSKAPCKKIGMHISKGMAHRELKLLSLPYYFPDPPIVCWTESQEGHKLHLFVNAREAAATVLCTVCI